MNAKDEAWQQAPQILDALDSREGFYPCWIRYPEFTKLPPTAMWKNVCWSRASKISAIWSWTCKTCTIETDEQETAFFRCNCSPGYSRNGTECVDVDECSENIDYCSLETTSCLNLPGSFSCECLANFTRCVQLNCFFALSNCRQKNAISSHRHNG